ncbi:MAG: TonB-dependent receptor [Bacteroidota bacterium]
MNEQRPADNHWQKNCLGVLLLLLFGCFQVFAQSKTISGVVTNSENRQPIEGVTIAVKGSTQNAITNSKGEYTISVPSPASVLVFSYVGKTRQERKVGTETIISLELVNDDKSLDDVVVVGYGTQKRTHLTGAVSTVSVKDIEDLPVGSLSATLQGRMAGVAVGGGTSRPGSPASIVIRNPIILSKDGGTTGPLYVIDDVLREESDFNMLDATEVENISVLKDAAAAIYGIRGAQGVVVVKTRRGQAGKPRFTLNSSVAFNDATSQAKMLDGYQLATYLNSRLMAEKAYVPTGPNNSGYEQDPKYYTPDELAYFRNNNYNWLDNAWKSSMVTRHAFNVSGGTDRATFFAGASYFYQNGNLDKISNDKWTFRASADIKVSKGLKVGITVNGDLSNSEQYLLKQGGENPENDIKGLLYTPGFTPPYVNGLPVRMSTANQNTIENFHFFEAQRLNNYNNSKGSGMNVMANIDYQVPFIKGLSIKGQYSKTIDNNYPKQFGTSYKVYNFSMLGENRHIVGGEVLSPVVNSNGNRIYLKPSYYDQYQLNGYLNYNRKFGKHEIGLVAVAEQSESMYSDVQTVTENPTEGAPDNARFAFGAEDVFETENEIGRIAYFGRVNYNFDNKYLVEVALRNDYSAKFAPEYRSGYFPSASVGWVISEENFFQKAANTVNYLKVRASAGLLGSDNTKAWPYLQRYTPGATAGAVFGGNLGRSVGTRNESMPNRATQWDDNAKFNVGVDSRFLQNRLSATVEVYYDYRYNMLTTLAASVPLTVGSTISSENFSTIAAYGTEISLGWKDKVGRNFNYNINGFLTWNEAKNIKTDVAPGEKGTYLDPTGKSTDMGFLGYEYLGMFRSQSQIDDWMSKNPGYTVFNQAPRVGMLYYRDIRGAFDATTNKYGAPDGKIDNNDQDFIARKATNHYGFGLTLGAGYKSLRIDMVISGAFGGQGSVEGAARKLGTPTSSRPAFWSDHWTPANVNAQYPNPYESSSYDVSSAFWFRSAFTCRMRNLNISYALPAQMLTKAGISNLKIYMAAINPINFYNPYDYKDNALGSFDSYPNLRTISFGINATL